MDRGTECSATSLTAVARVIGAIGVAGLLAVGCGGNSDDPETAASVETPTPASTASPSPSASASASASPSALPSPTPTVMSVPTPTPTPTPTPVEVVSPALNHMQVIGSHNSYHLPPEPAILDVLLTLAPELAVARHYAHDSLTEQLEVHGIRQFELDVYADPDGGLYAAPAANPVVGLPPIDDPAMAEPGYKVLHAQDYDYSTTCPTLIGCLTEIAQWSDSNPRHLPLLIMLEYKSESVPDSAMAGGVELPIDLDWTEPLDPTAELLAELDNEVRSVFAPERIIEPDDVRRGATTLEGAVLDTGWPSLDEARGQVLFALTGAGVRDLYVADSPSLEGRPMFTDGIRGQPDAAFLVIDDPADPRLDQAVLAGYLVRTRTDEATVEARVDDRTRRDTALAGGAHFLSTDYYRPSEFFASPYMVELPGGVVARCNPVSAPATCRDEMLAE